MKRTADFTIDYVEGDVSQLTAFVFYQSPMVEKSSEAVFDKDTFEIASNVTSVYSMRSFDFLRYPPFIYSTCIIHPMGGFTDFYRAGTRINLYIPHWVYPPCQKTIF